MNRERISTSTLLATALLVTTSAHSVAGDSSMHSTPFSTPIAEHNPLSFFDDADFGYIQAKLTF